MRFPVLLLNNMKHDGETKSWLFRIRNKLNRSIRIEVKPLLFSFFHFLFFLNVLLLYFRIFHLSVSIYWSPQGGSRAQPYLSFSFHLSRGRWRRVGYGWCSLTSTRRAWAPAPPLTFDPRRAALAAWSRAASPPSRTDTTWGWPLWARWCSAWPRRVAWPCECSLFFSMAAHGVMQFTAVFHWLFWCFEWCCRIFFFSFTLQHVWNGGQRGVVRSGDGVQQSGELGRPDRRHRSHSWTSAQTKQHNTQRRGQCCHVSGHWEAQNKKVVLNVFDFPRFVSPAVVRLQKYPSGLAPAAPGQRQDTKCPKSNRCVRELQAAERMSRRRRRSRKDQLVFPGSERLWLIKEVQSFPKSVPVLRVFL